jgi:DNA-binding PadR family transcriptional regulator
MLKNHLKIIVMNKLKDKSMSGYDLIKDIHNSTGSWKPSFGSMYPLLKSLNQKKLLSVKTINRRKVYSLTSQGRKVLDDALKASSETMSVLLKEFKVMESICSPKEHKQVQSMITHIKQDPFPFGNLSDDIHRLQHVMIDLHTKGKFKTKEKEIKDILKVTISNLKRL